MLKYLPYTNTLEELALFFERDGALARRAALDGQAGRELARQVALKSRRKYGAFFTGSTLAARLVGKRTLAGKILDPAVGAGDLLLAAARRLPMGGTLRSTIALWSRRLAGLDLHDEFIRAAKARLVVLARARGEFEEELTLAEVNAAFPLIRKGNALRERALFSWADWILVNPPFVKQNAPRECLWAQGSVNSAGVFMEHLLVNAGPSTQVLAVLPEVLRSGTRYRAWRKRISGLATVGTVTRIGLFDTVADVDVFTVKLTRRQSVSESGKDWKLASNAGKRIGKVFTVNVGAVVPHRDDEEGAMRRYLDARGAKAWQELVRLPGRRRYPGRVFSPPFVVIKRTSRPGDVFRATAAIVRGRQPVAVENHLIVCRPNDSTVARCRELLAQLRSKRVNNWLNRSIRCRHLTVSSVASIPLA